MSGEAAIAVELVDLLTVFGIAAIVGIFVAKVGRFPYTIALLLAGLATSILNVQLGIELSHDLILLVLLPPLLFEGAATTDLDRFRANALPIALLAVPGLIISVILLGFAGSYVMGLPLLVGILFATTILPTDPVSVLALFDEMGAPDRLSVLVEGESLVNDGVGVVLFSTVFGLITAGVEPAVLLQPARVLGLAVQVAVVSLGGMLVGLGAGYGIYRVMVPLDEHMTEIVLTMVLAYGSFVVAEHYLGVSGVIATVTAGLLIGNRGAEHAMSARTKVSVFNTWETAAFIVNTFIFVAIGARIPVRQLLANADLISVAIVLTLLARAAIVYPTVLIANRWLNARIQDEYSHVMVWGGLHASIPIALVLGIPADAPVPRTTLTAMVFGVAAFSLVVQGLTIERLLDWLDIGTRSEAERLYELLVGRLRAVEAALDAADSLRNQGDIPRSVYEKFREEYENEKDDLEEAISRLLSDNPELHEEELLMGERQVLRQEESAIMDAVQSGSIADDVGEELAEEVDLKLDRVRSGNTTVRDEGEGYEEFWRQRSDEFGLSEELVTTEEESEEESEGHR